MSDLRLRPLVELCDLSVDSIDPRRSPDREFFYIDITAVDNTVKSITAPQKIAGKQASVRARQLIRVNDVLVATTRPNLNAVALVPDKYDREVCSTGFCVLRAGKELDPDYLFCFVQSQAFIEPLTDLTKGGLYPAVSDKQVFSQVIPWASISKQRKIAARLKALLAEVEAARQAVKIQLQEAAALRSKVLETLFAGVKNWAPIGTATKLQSGYAFKSDTFKTTGVRLLRNANILPGRVYWDDAVCLSEEDSKKHPGYVLKDGDVLISLDRPIISSGIKVARVGSGDLPALLVQRVGRFLIDPSKLDADYLYACLQTDLFISEISGHDQSLGVPHISPSQVESVEIPMPEVSVQRELSKRLNEVLSVWRTAATAIQVQLNDLSSLPKAILAQAFDQQGDRHGR